MDAATRSYLENKMNEEISMLPRHMHDAIRMYVLDRLEPGSFLMSVLCNDLKGSIARADHINKSALPQYVEFCTWYLPSICWGSEERVTAWLSRRDEEPEIPDAIVQEPGDDNI